MPQSLVPHEPRGGAHPSYLSDCIRILNFLLKRDVTCLPDYSDTSYSDILLTVTFFGQNLHIRVLKIAG